jgi:hypothetical protein
MSKSILKKAFTGIIFAGCIASITQANAASYLYEVENPTPSSKKAGKISSFSTIYDDVTEQLSFKSTIQRANGNLANGFWLVLSDGPNPKTYINEYAIIYGDGNTGNLTSYVYDGTNSSNSWEWSDGFIQSFAGDLNVTSTTNEVTFDFSIDASAINAYTPKTRVNYGNDWDGVSFGENIGIWYHPTIFKRNAAYDNNGLLTSFPVRKSGWYDIEDGKTTPILPDVTPVPAPAAAWLIFVGLIGFFGTVRRQK